MAITTTTISKNAGWARTDVIYQLEEAFTWLGWHGSTRTGIVTGISAYSGGGTVGSSYTSYFDVSPATTTGIGTGASFFVQRSNGPVNAVYVNRPGVGYTNGEYVTLSAADIGGAANGAVAIGITILVAGGASPIGYGTTTAFYDKDVTAGATHPWGVMRHEIQAGKKFGNTYNGFQVVPPGTVLYFASGSDFHPWNVDNTSNRGNGYSNRFAGSYLLDNVSGSGPTDGGSRYVNDSTSGSTARDLIAGKYFANSNSYQLDLNIYRSGLDPNFAVLSFRHPTLSSTVLSGNTYATFIIHNFTTSLWDLNNLYLGGITSIEPEAGNSIAPRLYFYSYNGDYKRIAEWGYSNTNEDYKQATYVSNSYNTSSGSVENFGIYLRNNATTSDRGRGGDNNTDALSDSSNFNAVIKGLPLNPLMVPSPYYMPDDFVLIDFDYETPSANIQQGDTITISGSEVYTVITGSYNQTTRTRGILFCARTV